MNIYALYDGETLIADGSIREIAIQTGIPEGTIRWYGSKEARERNIRKALIKLEEDEDMFLGSNIPRSKTTHSIYAPTPTNDENDPQERSVTIIRGLKPAEWKPSEYNRQLFNQMFKRWEGVSVDG